MMNASAPGFLVLFTLSTAYGADRKHEDTSAGRNIATPNEARGMLGLKGAENVNF